MVVETTAKAKAIESQKAIHRESGPGSLREPLISFTEGLATISTTINRVNDHIALRGCTRLCLGIDFGD